MRRTRFFLTAALAAALVTAVTTGATPTSANTKATPTATPHNDTVPVAGTFAYPQLGDHDPGVVRGVINAVVRIPHGTAVFYSLGSAQTGTAVNTGIMPTMSLDEPYSIWKFPAWSVGVLDPQGLNVYRPLVASEHGCLCSGAPDLTANSTTAFRVGWAVLPPLPKGLTRVTVDIAGGIQVPDVPVTSSMPAPTSREAAPLLGHGWPRLPSASAIESADRKQATLPVAENTSTATQSVSAQKKDVSVALNADVLFAFNKATLSPAASSTIASLAKRINADAAGAVTIVGYTDSTGDASYNQALSQQRAAAVLAALKPLVTNTRVTLTASGKGEEDPVATNDTDAGRALNRRVTVAFSKADR
jgi:Outer membrane protein and related peptidoglycan-associated (lipo)proteins